MEVVDTRNVRSTTTLPTTCTEGWVKNYPEPTHLKSLVFYINASAHDNEDVPSGTLAIHSPEAKVHPDSIPASIFQHIVAVPIRDCAEKPNGWVDADFAGKEDVLQRAAPQYGGKPPLLSVRDVDTNADGEEWIPELGQDDSFAGIFKSIRSNMRDADYYVVVKAGAPEACTQLKEALISEGGVTYGELVKDPRVSYVNHLALRNAKRLAYQIARDLKAPIASGPDHSAYTRTSFIAKPERAEPTSVGFQHTVSSVQRVQHAGQECVGVFHKVRPSTECLRRNVVVGSPYDGIHVFTMGQKPLGFAVPTSTGLQRPLDEANLEHPETAKRHRGVVWEGEETALKVLAPNMYHPIDDEFYRGMDQMGWKQAGTNKVAQLVPVLLKVSNMDYKRAE